jgi:isoleucyl-tRNA synthetase
MDPEIREHIKEELNVLRIDLLSDESDDLVSISIKANFRSIGARYGGDVQAIAAAIAGSDATKLVHELRQVGSYSLTYGEKSAELTAEDLVITETPKEGWSVASHSGESVALDLALTPTLLQAGLAREVIRTVQEQRKNSGFEISDRIHFSWNGSEEIGAAIAEHLAQISDEVLALSITQDPSLPAAVNEIGLALHLTKA